jgi:hypothetical protein
MGFDNQINIRISLPFDTKDGDILDFVSSLTQTIKDLKASAGV